MDYKFFDPETGKPLHRVPAGATIQKNTPHGYIRNGERWWLSRGLTVDWHQEDGAPRFTREPITQTAQPLPTESGYYTGKDGTPFALRGSSWYMLGVGRSLVVAEVRSWTPLVPVSHVPTETWDRLRVLDPEDKRDRVDRNGDVWHLMPYDKWETSDDRACVGISTLHRYYGPLRFADEVSDQ